MQTDVDGLRGLGVPVSLLLVTAIASLPCVTHITATASTRNAVHGPGHPSQLSASPPGKQSVHLTRGCLRSCHSWMSVLLAVTSLQRSRVRTVCINQSTNLPMALQPFVRHWPLFHFLDPLSQSVGLLARGICPSQSRYLHTEHEHRINAHTSGIRTQDPSVRAGEDSSCLRTGGHCDRLAWSIRADEMVSFLLASPTVSYMHSSSPHSYCMPCPSNLPLLDHSNYIWRKIQVMKHLIMKFSPTSCHFVSLRSKYSPQHPVLKRPQSVFLPQCQRPSCTPIQNQRQNYSFVCSNRNAYRILVRKPKERDN
jgi:hypothetical protein